MNCTFTATTSSLDCCIKCNICTSACPVHSVTDLFPGPKYVGPQSERFRQFEQPTPDISVDYCIGCRVCNMVCPYGVKIAEMNTRARAALVEQQTFTLKKQIRNKLLSHTEFVGTFGHLFSPISNSALSNKNVRWLTEKALDVHRDAPLPKFASHRFTDWWKNHSPSHAHSRKVVYFHGCSTEYYQPWVGHAAVGVLEKIGFEVIVPEQNCCGLPFLSNGDFKTALQYHQRNINSLYELAKDNIPIVGTSVSCILTLKEEANDLLILEDEKSQVVAQNIYDFNEFVLLLSEENNLGISPNPFPLSIVYHPPCQYRAHLIGNPGEDLLNLIPEINIITSPADCCGIAGTHGYKLEKYSISMDVGQNLFNFIKDTGVPLVVCDNETCRWQINHATGIPVVHPVELLAYSYSLDISNDLSELVNVLPTQDL